MDEAKQSRESRAFPGPARTDARPEAGAKGTPPGAPGPARPERQRRAPPEKAPVRGGVRPGVRVRTAAAWAIFLIATLAYLPTLRYGFVWDDVNFIAENPAAHGTAGVTAAFSHGYGWVPTGENGADASLYFRPLVTISNAVTWSQAGGKPWLFHLKNVVSHAGTATLVTVLATWLGVSAAGALLAGGVFAVHPVLSEAVAWISGRTDVFAGFWVLAALVLLTAWRQGRLRRLPRPVLLATAAVCMMLALASKESAAALILLGPLLVLAPAAAFREIRADRAIERTPDRSERGKKTHALLALAAAFAVYAGVRIAVLGAGAFGRSATLPGRGAFGSRLLLGGNLLLTYLARIVFPRPLAVEPPPGLAHGSGSPALGAIGLLLLAGAGVFWIRLLVRTFSPEESTNASQRPPMAAVLGLGLFLLGLLPVLQFIPTGEIYGERFLYLPLAGLLLFLASTAGRSLAGRPARAWIAAAVIGIPFVVLLEARIPAWKDEISLFRSAVETRPQSARALANLGSALMKAGDNAGAGRYLAQAVALDPNDPLKHAQYGSLLVNTGRFPEGARELEAAYRSGARSKTLLKNLGIAWTRTGRYDDAARILTDAQSADPQDPALADALGMAERKRGRRVEAAAQFERALAIDPARKGAWLNLVGLYVETGDLARAREWAGRFVARFPNAPEAAQMGQLIQAGGR